MISISIFCLGLIASDPASGTPTLPEPLIRQALEFEAAGQHDRMKQFLDAALRADPDNAQARGLLGQVQYRGEWLTAVEAIAREKVDAEQSAVLTEYEQRRAATRSTSAAHWKLALWCEQNGLKAEATAHLTEVTRIDPGNRAAWLKLGCRLYQGRWLNEEQIVTLEAEAEDRDEADREWRPRLARWKSWLANPAKQPDATRELASVRDPRAVPSIVRVFDGAPKWQRWAVYLLGRIDSPAAAQALASLAVNGLNEPIRESAIRRLKECDPRSFVGLLINWIRQPTRYEVQSPSSRLDDTVVMIQAPDADIERHYRAVASTAGRTSNPDPQVRSGRVSILQSNGHYELFDRQVRVTPTRGAADRTDRAKAAVDERVSSDIREIDQANEPIEERNVRVLHTLYQVTGKSLGDDRQAWTSWWSEQLGYRYATTPSTTKPLITQEIATPYVPPPPPVIVTQSLVPVRPHSCFGEGTPVLTRAGLRPIEGIKVGDQVLTQDTTSGALGFQPVLAALHNPPSTVLRLTFANGERIVATDIHRFWHAGHGWKMTRELKPGDRLRSTGGTTEIVAVTREPTQLVYNLEVARKRDFFVGRSGVLVHDATLVAPEARAFDRVATR